MKNIKYLIISSAIIIFFIACREESKNPFPEKILAPSITIGKVISPEFNFSKLNTSFYEAELNDFSGKAKSYKLKVTWQRVVDGKKVISDTVDVKTITKFPSNLKVTIQEVAKALKVNVSDFKWGERINFLGQVSDGKNTWGYNTENLNQDLYKKGQKLAYRFPVYIACPSSLKDVKVKYEVLSWKGEKNKTIKDLQPEDRKGVLTWEEGKLPFSYHLDKITFGTYGKCCDAKASNSIEVFDICGKLSITPKDRYKAKWSIKVNSVKGNEMILTLTSSKTGVIEVKMTRSDGKKWPITPN